MRKAVLVMVLMALALVLPACGNTGSGKPKAGASGQTAQQATKSQSGNTSSKSTNPSSVINNSTYEIIGANYTKGTIKVNYPQVSKLSDSSKEKTINGLIKSEALKGLKYFPDEHGLTLTIDYAVKWKGPRLLSIQYSGTGNVASAARPDRIFYTTNIDMITGTRLRLVDLVNINKNFIADFKDGKFKALISFQKSAVDEFSDKQLLTMFTNADSLNNIGTAQESDTFSYFTKDSLGISVPVSGAMGDHAEFEIKYQEIAGDLKANEVWKDFSVSGS